MEGSIATVRVRLCGAFGIEVAGEPLSTQALPGRQGRLVFAYLSCGGSRVVSRDELAELLWPDQLPGSWPASVSAVVSKLRRLLDDVGLDSSTTLMSSTGGYRFDPPDDLWVDWVAAQQGAATAERALTDGDQQGAIEEASAAIAISSGGFLAESCPWVDAESRKVRDVWVAASLVLAEAQLRAGTPARAVEVARQVVDLDPTREAGYRLLMQALGAAGERAEALRVWECCRASLVEELGVSPSAATEQVYLELLGPPVTAAVRHASALPSGVVTFLMTDIVDSSGLWERDAVAMDEALRRHDDLIADVVTRHGGTLLKTKLEGDATVSVFERATAGGLAALAILDALSDEPWPADVAPVVRVALHTGEAVERDGDYFGPALNRTARVRALAAAGQVLLSQATAELVADHLPDGVQLVERGLHDLRGLSRAENLFELGPGDRIGEDAAQPRVEPRRAGPGRLPVQSTQFIGRDSEVAELVDAVRATTIVTLTGVGGVGKTRLALEVAAQLAKSFRDGARFVELGGVVTPEAVVEVVSTAVGFSSVTSGRAGLLDFLRARELLLVLDNCEHLLAPVAEFVEGVLGDAPRVHLLATSREGLGVAGEHVRVVPSLGVPAATDEFESIAAAEAVRLFVERAREASLGFELGDDAVVVAELCRRLDGIPLAIELAAARVSSMTPAEIAEHLDHRFKLLTGGRRAAVNRQRTLHNAIEWSYQLLEPDEQAVFDRLAVFADGFDLTAAQAVAADGQVEAIEVLDLLARLVAKSLVLAERHDDATRYRMLETVREFAWERLAAANTADDMGRCHAEYFAAFAREAGAGLRSPDEVMWRARIARERDNLRAGVAWAIAAHDETLALEPISELSVAGDDLVPYGAIAADAARLNDHHRLTPVALGAASWAASMRGDLDAAQRFSEQAHTSAEALERTPEGLWVRCRVHNATCIAAAYSAIDLDQFARSWLTDARELGDPWCLLEVLNMLVSLSADNDEAIRVGDEALEFAKQVGAPSRLAFVGALFAPRVIERDQPRAEELVALAESAAAMVDNDYVDYVTAMGIADVYLSIGQPARAASNLLARIEGSLHDLNTTVVVSLAAALAALGDDDGALVLTAWCEQRGIMAANSFDHMAVLPGSGVPTLAELRGTRSKIELDQIDRAAADLDEVAIAKLVRGHMAQ